MKKFMILLWLLGSSIFVSSLANAGSFYLSEETPLRANVDYVLTKYFDESVEIPKYVSVKIDGMTYQIVNIHKQGNCVVSMVLDSEGKKAPASICSRRSKSRAQRTSQRYRGTQVMAPAQQVQYQRAIASTPIRQSYSGWFTEKPGLQYDLRGKPNAPHMVIEPLRVNPNDIARMSPTRRIEELRFVQDWNAVAQKTGETDRYNAHTAHTWMNKTNSNNQYPGESALKSVNESVNVLRGFKDLFKY